MMDWWEKYFCNTVAVTAWAGMAYYGSKYMCVQGSCSPSATAAHRRRRLPPPPPLTVHRSPPLTPCPPHDMDLCRMTESEGGEL